MGSMALNYCHWIVQCIQCAPQHSYNPCPDHWPRNLNRYTATECSELRAAAGELCARVAFRQLKHFVSKLNYSLKCPISRPYIHSKETNSKTRKTHWPNISSRRLILMMQCNSYWFIFCYLFIGMNSIDTHCLLFRPTHSPTATRPGATRYSWAKFTRAKSRHLFLSFAVSQSIVSILLHLMQPTEVSMDSSVRQLLLWVLFWLHFIT